MSIYHAIWLDGDGDLHVVTSNGEGEIISSGTVRPAIDSSTDDPIILTDDGLDMGNEKKLRPRSFGAKEKLAALSSEDRATVMKEMTTG